MDRDAVLKQMKALKAKARAARKAGKKEIAATFHSGAARLIRQLKATKPREQKKAEG